jgi:MFS family permease
MSTATAEQASPSISAKGGIWGRQLGRYPANGPRAFYLLIVIIATIVLYYELYVGGSVATKLAADLDMSLTFLITVSIVGNAVGALASIFAGAADRWGRSNLVVYGLLVTGALIYAVSYVHTKWPYLILIAVISFVEGMILVATPALIRDFSPQLGRASAMGFWTLGPVMGSLVVTEVSSHTLDAHPDWQYQFRICGIVGVAIFVVAFFGLRELAPQLRDQLMVSLRDKALVEAKARGIDPEKAVKGHWGQMLRFDIIGSSFAVAVFLLFYYIAVGLFVVFFATNYGYTEAQGNSLGNWYWSVQVIALILTGLVSDWLKVRKPFMIIGAVISAVGVALFALYTTKAAPSGGYEADHGHWVTYILLISIGSAIAFAAWMAAFTETVEKHNPAATATGLAVWGSTLRLVVVVALIGLIYAIPAASTLVDKGPKLQQIGAVAAGQDPKLSTSENAIVKAVAADPTIVTRVQGYAAQYKDELVTASALKPATQAALAANPNDPATQAEALSEISAKLSPPGLSVADVAKTIQMTTQYAQQIATAKAIDNATIVTLFTNPSDVAAQGKAVGEIMAAFHLDQAGAAARLQALAAIPPADLLALQNNAVPLQTAADALTKLGKVPPAALQLLAQYGPGLQDPKVVANLQYLQANEAYVQANLTDVTKAATDSPKQWQNWWWICLGGQIVFLPFIFVLTGRWSPRKAREDAKAHEEAVDRELAALASAPAAGEATA